jgi:predicted P-loop ATPase
MMILIGEQGDGKTTFFKYLACKDEWFNDNFNFKSLDSKAVVEAMSGKWILEMGEMDTMKKDAVTADALKAFVTSQQDTYRVPFGRRPENRKRQCVFCGTSNDVNFLKDRTGNRRFLPVDCNKRKATKNIFDEESARQDFIQAVAEAVHLYKSNPKKEPVLPRHLEAQARQAQSEHLEEDSWVTLITEYLSQTARERVNVLCILDEGFKQDLVKQRRSDINRILTIMRHDIHGWHEIGKARIPNYGNNAVCFERDAPIKEPGFVQLGADEEIPF